MAQRRNRPNLTKAKKELEVLKKKSPGSPMIQFAEAVLHQEESLQNKLAELKKMVLPGAFTGDIPDTPEAAIARRQLRISKGEEWDAALPILED